MPARHPNVSRSLLRLPFVVGLASLSLSAENFVREIPPQSEPAGLVVLAFPSQGEQASVTALLEIETPEGAPFVQMTTTRPPGGRAVRFDITRYFHPYRLTGELRGQVRFIDAESPEVRVLTNSIGLKIHPQAEHPLAIESLLTPLWTSRTITAEPVFLLNEGDGTGWLKLPLLGRAESIEAVRAFDGQSALDPAHWRRTAEGSLEIDPSAVATIAPEALYFESDAQPFRVFNAQGGGFFRSVESGFFAENQVLVDYTVAEPVLPVPDLRRAHLAAFRARAATADRLRVAVLGDSISVGANCSARSNRAPFQAPWADLVAMGVENAYGIPVDLLNPSSGGRNSTWGLEKVGALVASQKPDLAILAFGMNDRIPPESFQANIAGMIERIRAQSPDCAFILVGSMRPNPLWRDIPHERLAAYAAGLRQLEGEGVAVADLWEIHGRLLASKRYLDLTGNNANHPNDFLAAVYAQAVFDLLRP